MAIQQLADGNPDGTLMGQGATSTDKIGFFGVTPVIQQTASSTPTLVELGVALRALGLLAP